jgi:hypothetical protein
MKNNKLVPFSMLPSWLKLCCVTRKRQAWTPWSMTLLSNIWYCAFKNQSPLKVDATFLINIIAHWLLVYVVKSYNYSYSLMKLLPMAITSLLNFPSTLLINNCFRCYPSYDKNQEKNYLHIIFTQPSIVLNLPLN